MREVPRDLPVIRAAALDTARHLSIRGAYLRCLALPDRWASWWLGGLLSGLLAVRRYRPDIIWSTYPIATAHLIGLTLHRLSGIPWIADFRDSMTEDNYPRDRATWKVYRWIEKETIERSSMAVFTARSARDMYLDRYPHLTAERCLVIPNGYDEEDFRKLTVPSGTATCNFPADRPLRLLHAGLVYPEERDPRAFFAAAHRLKKQGLLNGEDLIIDLRAPGSEELYTSMIRTLGIEDMVRLLPALPYWEALQDYTKADALLLLQAASCNHQIPAKVYEYLRMGKPILALTSHAGDTAGLLRETGGATIVDLADEESIAHALPAFVRSVRNGAHPLPMLEKVMLYSRQAQAHQLAESLTILAEKRALNPPSLNRAVRP